jgi:acylphosphatase
MHIVYTLMNKICIRCFISGRVQGVWFRASTKIEADRLSITGWACNLPDGRVEVFACGEKEHIQELYEWLKHGPSMAKVEDISYEELAWQDNDDFVVS